MLIGLCSWLLPLACSAEGDEKMFAKVEMGKPLSFHYRFVHAVLALAGALIFIVGSIQYFPSQSNPLRGGALFTIGSFFYFFDDFTDFLYANKLTFTACASPSKHLHDAVPTHMSPGYCLEWFRYHVIGLNAFLTAMGSIFYLIGCVLFIPNLNNVPIGNIIFIPGSCIIMISEGWKLHRAGCVYKNESGYMFIGRHFRWVHVWNGELVLFMGDLATWLGSALFLAGSVVFLPQYDTNSHDTVVAALIFLIGSSMYLLCAVCLCWKYFFSGYHDSAPGMWESMCWKGIHADEITEKVVQLEPLPTNSAQPTVKDNIGSTEGHIDNV